MGVGAYCDLDTLDLKVPRAKEWTVSWGRLFQSQMVRAAWQEAVFAVVGAARDALVHPVMCPSSSSCALHQLGVRACYQVQAVPDLVEHGETGLFLSLL